MANESLPQFGLAEQLEAVKLALPKDWEIEKDPCAAQILCRRADGSPAFFVGFCELSLQKDAFMVNNLVRCMLEVDALQAS